MCDLQWAACESEHLPLLVITREYKGTRQELLAGMFNSSVIAREQCISRVGRAQHMSYLQIFSRPEVSHTSFVNLEVSCTAKWKGNSDKVNNFD